jgi:hypothetical protein
VGRIEFGPTSRAKGGCCPDPRPRITFSLWWSQGDPLDNEREGELQVRADELPVFAAQMRELTGLHGNAERFRRVR